MWQARLISVSEHTFQFQHVQRLGIRKCRDVPSTINKRFWPYLPISAKHTGRLGIRRYWNDLSTINKRSLPYLPIKHAQRLGIKLYSYVPSMINISVFDHTFQFQHVYRLGIASYWDVLSTINKRPWPYLPTSTCPKGKNKTVLLRCAKYD